MLTGISTNLLPFLENLTGPLTSLCLELTDALAEKSLTGMSPAEAVLLLMSKKDDLHSSFV